MINPAFWHPTRPVSSHQIETHTGAAALPADARALLDQHARQTLQFSAAWFANLEATVFPGHPGVCHFVLRTEGKVAAVLPLLVTPGRLSHRAQALGNYYTCLYEPALADDVDATQLGLLFKAVRRYKGGISTLTLAPMSLEGRAFTLVEQALAAAGFKTERYFCFGNWHLQAPPTWAAYLAGREGKLRSTIKRMAQKLAAEQAQIEILTEPADLERGIAAYHAVYAKSWKVPEPSADFMPGLMRLCGAAGALRLGLVWLHGQPIAAQLWMVHGGRAEVYKLAYDEAFKGYSPGTVLTARLMQHVMEHDKVTEVDYLLGDDAYKTSWMSHRRERWGLVAYNQRSLTGMVLWHGAQLKRLVKPWVLRLRAAVSRSTADRSA